jgi:hypothetical protein
MTTNRCSLCHRVTKRGTTGHHLIPRTCHSNKWFKKRFTRERMNQIVDVCRDCHKAIHRLIPDEKELGRSYNTVEALQSHEEINKFIRWVRRQR